MVVGTQMTRFLSQGVKPFQLGVKLFKTKFSAEVKQQFVREDLRLWAKQKDPKKDPNLHKVTKKKKGIPNGSEIDEEGQAFIAKKEVYEPPENQVYLRKRYLEDLVEYMSHKLLTQQKQLPVDKSQRYMVGIAGVPGAGKTTAINMINQRINELSPNMSTVVSMDGYHYRKQLLLDMRDPDYAVLRRGAHWTFDADAFIKAIKDLKYYDTLDFKLPGFDHGVGDPQPDAIAINKNQKIILVEGNYLLLDMEPWNQLKALFNETWFWECQVEVAMERVKLRHVSNGNTEARARHRIDHNDRLNAQQVEGSKVFADYVIPSIPLKNGSLPKK